MADAPDPKEVWVVADAMVRYVNRISGMSNPAGVDVLAVRHQALYHEMMEQAEVVLEALAKHRQNVSDKT